MATSTSIGRVQPLYKGAYDPSATYFKLDNVYYEGSTYICKSNIPISGVTPAVESNYWQIVAQKGDQGIQGITGSFGPPEGTVTILPSGSEPNITITSRGPDTAKIFNFDFDLPAGPVGYDEVAASAESLPAGSSPTASANLVTEDDTTTLTFAFGIPSADGSGVQAVDNKRPTVDPSTGFQNVELYAVSYDTQNLTDGQKWQARRNINAIKEPSNTSAGQFLRFSNDGEWVGETINLVPTGAVSDVGRYLRKTASGMIWADIQSLPAGGIEGAPLIKNSVDNYDVTWGSFISNSEIDEIFNTN